MRIYQETFEAGHEQRFLQTGSIDLTSKINGIGSAILSNGVHVIAFPSTDEIYHLFWFRHQGIEANWNNFYPLFGWQDFNGNSIIGTLRLNGSAGIELYIGSVPTVIGAPGRIISDNTYACEVHIKIGDLATGSVQVWIDDDLYIDHDGQDTKPGAESTIGRLFYANQVNLGACYIDDIVVHNTSNSDGFGETGRVGIRRFASQLPDALRSTPSTNDAWQKSAGTNAEDLCDERPFDTTTYVYSVTDAQRQGWKLLPHTIPAGSLIKSVTHEHLPWKITEGAIYMGMKEPNGIDYMDPTITAVGVSPAWRSRRWIVRTSDGQPFVLSDLNQIQPTIDSAI